MLKVVYVIGTYPLLTTTFIDREIRMLRQWGVDLQIVAIRRPSTDTPLSNDQRELRHGVIYLLPATWWKLILSHLYFVISRPCRYFQTLGYLLTRQHPHYRDRIKTLLHFGEGVYAAYLVRHRQFQELHAHFVDRAATVALVAGRLLGKPYSLSIHAGADVFVNPVLLPEKIGEARQVVTCTRYNQSYLEATIGQGLSHKMSYIPHGLELTVYRPDCSPKQGSPVILSVGQLVGRKGFAQLIQACRTLKDQGYDFRCHIVGRGPQHLRLQNFITALSLEDTVALLGALPHEDVIEQYQQATMFVLPCLKTQDGDIDGIPNVLVEAMAMGVPVISTTISAVPELLLDRLNGLLVPSEDHEALVAAIARLLTEPALREELGARGRQTIVDSFDVKRNVHQFMTTLWPENSIEHSFHNCDVLWR